MRKRKIAIALITALVMALTPMSVLAAPDELTAPGAANGSIGGDSTITPTIKMDVFRVQVTTLANTNFVVDPQGLLNKADPGNYKFGPGAVYFGKDKASQSLKFSNLSSMDVNVDLKISAEVSGNNVKVVDSEAAMTAETSPAVYLALYSVSGNDVSGNNVVENGSVVGKFTDTEETVSETLDRVPEVVSGNDTKGYELKVADSASDVVSGNDYAEVDLGGSTHKYLYYGLSDGYDPNDADAISYAISGKCNSVDAWKEAQNDTVKTNIVWSVTKAGAATPTEPTRAYVVAEGDWAYISVALNENGGLADPSKISNVKVSLNDETPKAYAYNLDQFPGWIFSTWADLEAAGIEWDVNGIYYFYFTYDGVDYKAEINAMDGV